MAYTYDNILEEARKAGVLEKFSQEDHNTAQRNPEYGMSLVGLLKDANNATTEAQRLLATETVNQLRKSYSATGTGGAAVGGSFDGAQRLAAPEKAGTLASSDPTTYQTVLDDIVNQKEFTYDHEQDPVYQSYAKSYLREGTRASENALAQAAAMSGGRPSSYALSTAQQVGNQYAAALADMIPTLRQNALTEHQNDIAAKYDILSALEAKQQTEYQKELEEQNRNRLAIQDALTKYQTLGYATPDVAQILGIPEGMKYGETPQTGGVLNSVTTVPIGGVLDALVNGNSGSKDPTQTAMQTAAKIVGGLSGTHVSPSTAGGNTGSTDGSVGAGQDTYSITNEHNDAEGWVIVDGKKLSYTDLAAKVMSGEIVETENKTTKTYTYRFASNSGKAGTRVSGGRGGPQSVLDRKLLIT